MLCIRRDQPKVGNHFPNFFKKIISTTKMVYGYMNVLERSEKAHGKIRNSVLVLIKLQ